MFFYADYPILSDTVVLITDYRNRLHLEFFKQYIFLIWGFL